MYNSLETENYSQIREVDILAEYHTQQKTVLTDFLRQHSETPYTVEELAGELERLFGETAPGKSTLYRLINRLVEEGTVKRFVKGNSRHFVYQIAGGEDCHHHLHMKCTDCGRLIHMGHEQSEMILDSIFGDTSFEVDREQTTIFGVCAECRHAH